MTPAPTNGTDTRPYVAELRARGLAVCRIKPGTKSPRYNGWCTRSLEPDDFGPLDLIGVLGGPLSNGNRPGHALVIPELDDAAAVLRADDYLPPTGMQEGRPGKERDHRAFLVPFSTIPSWACSAAEQAAEAARKAMGHPGPFTKPFAHAKTGKEVLKFIGTGAQVVCPSPTNKRVWVGGAPGEPSVVPFNQLWDATCALALACGAKMPEVNKDDWSDLDRFTRYKAEQPGPKNIVDRAVAYLDTCDPSVNEHGGHKALLWAARVVVRGFWLGPDVGFLLLKQFFNPRCLPPWSDADLKHKCQEAHTKPYDKPHGWLLGETATAVPQQPPSTGAPPPKGGYAFAPLPSTEFFAKDFSPTWLVKRMLVKNQPIIIGAPKKSLKTSIATDLIVSLATGMPFLGTFDVYRPLRVGFISGESGHWAIQDTARRVCLAKGIKPEETNVAWDFRMPQLANPRDLSALAQGVKKYRVELLVIDPLYLCLMAGEAGRALDASNLFHTGPLFLSVAEALLEVGCTPALIHHAVKHLPEPGEPMELESLAYAGVGEFARQWLLLNRRKPYDPEATGSHKLWLSAGGSCGQSGIWALDVEEGQLQEDFTGRRWDVTVRTKGEATQTEHQASDDAKQQDRDAKLQRDKEVVLAWIDEHDPLRGGVGWTHTRNMLNWNGERYERACEHLLTDGQLERVEVQVPNGPGRTRTVAGLRRPSVQEGRGAPSP